MSKEADCQHCSTRPQFNQIPSQGGLTGLEAASELRCKSVPVEGATVELSSLSEAAKVIPSSSREACSGS